MADHLCSCFQDRVSHRFVFGCAPERAWALARIGVDWLRTLRAQIIPTGAIRLSRPVLFACQVQRRTVQSVRCRSCVQSVYACARARHVNNLIQQDAECSHEVGRKLFRLRCLHGLVLQEILVVDAAAIEQIRSRRTKTRCLGTRIRTLALPTFAKQV